MKSLLPFGEEIAGYPVRVVNERAVRAAPAFCSPWP